MILVVDGVQSRRGWVDVEIRKRDAGLARQSSIQEWGAGKTERAAFDGKNGVTCAGLHISQQPSTTTTTTTTLLATTTAPPHYSLPRSKYCTNCIHCCLGRKETPSAITTTKEQQDAQGIAAFLLPACAQHVRRFPSQTRADLPKIMYGNYATEYIITPASWSVT